MKHDWEPVDNQGYAMECVGCGAYISAARRKGYAAYSDSDRA